MIYFIKLERLKVRTVISENVDDKLLLMSLEDAQEFEIKPLIGTKLYELLQDEVEAGSVSVDNKKLLDDYLQPCLIKFALAYATDYMVYKFTNKSISLKTSDNSSPVSLDALQRLKADLKDKAEELATRMRSYIVANKSKYPTYFEDNENAGDLKPRPSGYAGGLYFDITKKSLKKFYGR